MSKRAFDAPTERITAPGGRHAATPAALSATDRAARIAAWLLVCLALAAALVVGSALDTPNFEGRQHHATTDH
jgi:hypothetical protein